MTLDEIRKIVLLNSINTIMEQQSRIYMLFYLLKISVRERDYEYFEIIAEFLSYLSESRRFNDSFISILEELSLFSDTKNPDDNSDESKEIAYLFKIILTSFFQEDVNRQSKIYYMRFL